jgi:hypothetical protein
LGNSARARAKTGQRQARDGNGKRASRRKKVVREEFPDDEELDVIPAAELELTRNAMNLAELKTRPATELVELGIPDLRQARQDATQQEWLNASEDLRAQEQDQESAQTGSQESALRPPSAMEFYTAAMQAGAGWISRQRPQERYGCRRFTT